MLYTVYMWLLIVAAVLCFGALLALSLPFARSGPVYSLITRAWARTIVRGSGVKLEVKGKDKVDVNSPYIYMSNHQSYFDVISQVGYLPHPVRFVAKKELAYLPLFGQLMWATGHPIVNRGNKKSAKASMQKAADKISRGTSILVYPEGTRSPDHRLGPFKKGGFMLAIQSGVPILPVSVSGTHPMMPKGGYSFTRSNVTMVFGDPVRTEGLSQDDMEELMDRTRAAIIENFPEDSPEREANREDPVLGRAGSK